MNATDLDLKIRSAAFAWLATLRQSGRSHFSREYFRTQFEFNGRQIALMDRQKGIWNPAGMAATLSVSTTERALAAGLYADAIDLHSGEMLYSLQAGRGLTNPALLRAAELQLPIIYFDPLPGGLYAPSFPVFVKPAFGANSVLLTFTESEPLSDGVAIASATSRSYVERHVWQRVHQPKFRGIVMEAYRQKCSVCTFGHVEMLDAAHIMGDRHELGQPIVQNGLALCKIHHAAYDSNVIGISPDYRVRVAPTVLAEINGPMLRHGIQAMHDRELWLPSRPAERPDRERLAQRYAEFRARS